MALLASHKHVQLIEHASCHIRRGRSRHTSGFEPFETFELAPQELIASAQPIGSEQSDVHLQPTQGSPVFQWVQSSLGDAELADAASRWVTCSNFGAVGGTVKLDCRSCDMLAFLRHIYCTQIFRSVPATIPAAAFRSNLNLCGLPM